MWIFAVDVDPSGGCFPCVHLSSGVLVLHSSEDKGAAFPQWKAAAEVVPLGIFGAVCPSHGPDTSFASVEWLGIPRNALKAPAMK